MWWKYIKFEGAIFAFGGADFNFYNSDLLFCVFKLNTFGICFFKPANTISALAKWNCELSNVLL